MIDRILLKNFRGFKDLTIDNLSLYTIVSGTNNTGKSSVLEALYFLFNHSKNDVFAQLNSLRGGFSDPLIKVIQSMFYGNTLTEPLKISVFSSDENLERALTFGNREAQEQFFVQTSNPMVDFSNNNSNATMSSQVTPLKIDYVENRLNKDSQAESKLYSEEIILDCPSPSSSQNSMQTPFGTQINFKYKTYPSGNLKDLLPTLLVNSSTFRNPLLLLELLGRIELLGRKEILIGYLKLVEKDLTDIFSATSDGITQLFIRLSRQSNAIPLKYAGDGLSRFLCIACAVMIYSNGLILIDEIENGLHYSVYNKLNHILSKIAQLNNTQVIATTHSYDFISSSLRSIKKNNSEKIFSLHRLDNSDQNGMIKDNYFDYEMAEYAVQTSLEIR